MKDPLILHIETATKICSVALSEGKTLLHSRENDEDRSHASLLTRFIRECFTESNKEINQLNALNVSKGPGSYTGLRIGVSTTKGIAYALDKPVIATGTLQALASGALEFPRVQNLVSKYPDNLLLCPMVDARRMEVYTGFYRPDGNIYRKIAADIIEQDSYSELLNEFQICFFGDGSEKCKSTINHSNAHFIDHVDPSARYMIPLALKAFDKKQFEDVAYFEPYYLKEFVATIPKKKVI